MHHVEQGSVVFVDEHHHLAARLFAGPADKVCKTCVRIGDVRFDAEIPFQCLQLPQQVAFQSLLVQMLAHAHVEVQYGIFRPLRFQPLQSQTLKQFSTPFKIGVQSTCLQRVADTARTAQDYVI